MIIFLIIIVFAIIIGVGLAFLSVPSIKNSIVDVCYEGLGNSDIKMEDAWKNLDLCNSAYFGDE